MRKLVCFALLSLFVLPAVAQDGSVRFRLAVPLMMPQIAISPDGTLMAVFENPAVVRNAITPETLPIYLFDVSTGVEIGRFDGAQTDLTRAVIFTPDGTDLLSLHQNGDLIMWDVATQTAEKQWNWLPFNSWLLSITPDGTTAIVGNTNNISSQQIYFDLETGTIPFIYTRKPATYVDMQEQSGNIQWHGSYTLAVQAVNPQGDLVNATANGEIFVWDGSETTSIAPESEKGAQRFNVRRLHIRSDGTIVYFDNDTSETVLLSPTGVKQTLPFGSVASTLSVDGTLAFLDRDTDQIYIANIDSGTPEAQPLNIDLGDDINVNGQEMLGFTAAGDLIVTQFRQADDGEAVANTIFIVDIPETE